MRQWAIAVGINHYEFFQPLHYAQQDAQAIWQFLVAEAGVLPEHCILLTETSPAVWGHSTYPDRATIWSWLEHVTAQIQPGDTFWYFFSGYGVSWEGKDYLVPIDGDPAAIASSAIPVEAVLTRLSLFAAATILLLLDINRNEGALSHEMAGFQTADLSQQFGIPTILSCQPGQFSRETGDLRHGFFTAALLESLRYQGNPTLASLDHYLSDRLPELSHHYWRPIQQPLTLSPADKFHQPLLPLLMASRLVGDTATSLTEDGARVTPDSAVGVPEQMSVPPKPTNGHEVQPGGGGDLPATALPFADLSAGNGNQPGSNNRADSPPPFPTPLAPPAMTQASPPPPSDSSETGNPLLWRAILIGSGLLALLLLALVLWRNFSAIVEGKKSMGNLPSPTAPSPQKPQPLPGGVSPSLATSTAPTNPVTEQPSSPGTLPNPVSSPIPVQPASPVPVSAAPAKPGGVIASPGTLLAAARLGLVKSDQASPFWFAIQEARKIPLDNPDSAQVPQAIATWSQDILDLAQRRAQQRSYDNAILAALLIPPDHPPVYDEAQSLITSWCPLAPAQTARNPIQQKRVTDLCRSR